MTIGGNGNVDKGSGISDISPDDIESMSVLKGPAAAACMVAVQVTVS